MIRANITATDLPTFYAQICAAQQAAHGADYTAHHEVITRAVSLGCKTYCELGVNQGATVACALLSGFEGVQGIDKDIGPLTVFMALFVDWGIRCGVAISVKEQDSRIPLHGEVDFLLIDSLHEPDHVREELRVHGPNVRRFILAHDTNRQNYCAAIVDWVEAQGGRWTVQELSPSGCGHMLLARRP